MKIKQLTISDAELVQAVQAFLKTQGIDMPVHSVSKKYNWETESEVTFAFEVDTAPPPPTEDEAVVVTPPPPNPAEAAF